LNRGKTVVNLDLRWEKHVDLFKEMVRNADVLVEPFRPGVMEILKLGPDDLANENEALIYARLTGYGQTGDSSYEKSAGHDINYAALSGVLSMCKSPNSRPIPPVNLLADFAGGTMMCVQGILMALLERSNSGKGQVIDAAMIDGSAYLSSFLWKMINSEQMYNDIERAGTNLLDGGAPFYRCYECQDGKYVAVGCLERNFFEIFATQLMSSCEYASKEMGLTKDRLLETYADMSRWKEMERDLENVFLNGATRDEWAKVFDGTDACVTPVLSVREAEQHRCVSIQSFHFVTRSLTQPADT